MSAAAFHANLRAGFRQLLQAIPSLPAVAWEGKHFAPTEGVNWLTESLRPISSIVRGTGRGGYIAHTVTANLNVRVPADAGTLDLDAIAGSILEAFHPGTAIVYGPTSAIVQRAERLGNQQEPDWLSAPITLTMIGHTTN